MVMEGEEEAKEGLSRRTFVKGAMAAGTVGVFGAFVASLGSLFPPVVPVEGEMRNTFSFTKPQSSSPPWYKDLYGEEVTVDSILEGKGANTVWKGIYDKAGALIPFTGFPALLIRLPARKWPVDVPREEFEVNGVIAIFDCCAHACCRPGWQLISKTIYREKLGVDEGGNIFTYPVGSNPPVDEILETIYCPCHDSQYFPYEVSWYNHPPPPAASGARYVGVHWLAGPALRGMPLIPIKEEGNKIVGEVRPPADSSWYQYLDYVGKAVA